MDLFILLSIGILVLLAIIFVIAMNSITQVSDGIKESTGFDISSILSGFLGGRLAMPRGNCDCGDCDCEAYDEE